MPVVNDDWAFPNRWAPAKISWGVARDGDRLRFCRLTPRGDPEFWVVSTADFPGGAEPADRLQQDLRKGARLVAGLPPSVVLLRCLESPFKDPAKTREIRDSLLDAALPFSLEDCFTVFLPPRVGPDGIRLPAVAARSVDIQKALEEWGGLGLEPEMLVPESLLLPVAPERACVWLGEQRALFARVDEAGCVVCGGSGDASRGGRALSRFFLAAEKAPEISWRGPGGDGEKGFLEQALARAGLGLEAGGVNLRADSLAHDRLQRIHGGVRRRWIAAAALVMGLAVAAPWGVRAVFSQLFEQMEVRTGEVYEAVTGSPSPAREQERLLLERHADEVWGRVFDARKRLASSAVADALADALLAAQFTGAQVRDLQVRDAEIFMEVQAPTTAADALEARLAGVRPGAEWTREALDAERWRFQTGDTP